MLLTINLPKIINIGAIVSSGIKVKNGINNIDISISKPVTIAVRPVLPPAEMPAVPSTVDTEGLVPNSPQVIEDKATAIKLLFCFSGAFNNPVTWYEVFLYFQKLILKLIEGSYPKLRSKNLLKSKLNKIEEYSLKSGSAKPLEFSFVSPNIIEEAVPTIILIKKAPGIFFTNKNKVIAKITRKNTTLGLSKDCIFTKVAGSAIIRPLFCNPRKVIKNPIPTEIDSFKDFGIALSKIFDNLVAATIKNSTPAVKTLAKAWLKLRPKL